MMCWQAGACRSLSKALRCRPVTAMEVLQCTRALFLQRLRTVQDRAAVKAVLLSRFAAALPEQSQLPEFLRQDGAPERCGIRLRPDAVSIGCANAARGQHSLQHAGEHPAQAR